MFMKDDLIENFRHKFWLFDPSTSKIDLKNIFQMITNQCNFQNDMKI